MLYEKHLAAAREMAPEMVDGNLRSLAGDSRFAAVLALIERNRDSFIEAAASQKLCNHHGAMAHAQGSVHALSILRGQLRALLDTPPRVKSQGAPPEA